MECWEVESNTYALVSLSVEQIKVVVVQFALCISVALLSSSQQSFTHPRLFGDENMIFC